MKLLIQGVDIDNDGNIYISCHPSPSKVNGKYTEHHKQIIKILSYLMHIIILIVGLV